jgi:acyl-coenzyme A thioesterase PaaI-like protein
VVGIEAIAVDAGTATLRLPTQPYHYRPRGILHGGCCMTLADVTF